MIHASYNESSEQTVTPRLQIIPSQHHLQEILEMENPLSSVPAHVIAEYQSRGLIFMNDEGGLTLAAPVKAARQFEDDA